jgi:hypothetical protein
MLAIQPCRVVEEDVRRALVGFQFVDATTGLPIAGDMRLEVRGATVGDPPTTVALQENSVRIRQNRRRVNVIALAPFFDAYTSAFVNPVAPAETDSGPLRLRLGLVDAGPHYLPQEFHIDLPRSIEADDANNVFETQPVPLLRAPSAPVQDGWTVLRVLVTQTVTDPAVRLPGVLLRVFRSPRTPLDEPLGVGMTDWRGDIRGEALVPIAALQRFRPGAGPNVIETDHAIEFEAARDTDFTAATGQLPDVARLVIGIAAGLVRPPNRPPGSVLTFVPALADPLRVQAGREYAVHLAMT